MASRTPLWSLANPCRTAATLPPRCAPAGRHGKPGWAASRTSPCIRSASDGTCSINTVSRLAASRGIGNGVGRSGRAGHGVLSHAYSSPSSSSRLEELNRFTIAELKEQLRQQGLRVGGRKAELVHRLLEHEGLRVDPTTDTSAGSKEAATDEGQAEKKARAMLDDRHKRPQLNEVLASLKTLAGTERLARAPLHLQLGALEAAIEFMYRRIGKSKLKMAERYIRQRRNAAKEANDSSVFYSLADMATHGGTSNADYIKTQISVKVDVMAVKGISIKVKARKPDTGKVVTVDDTEVFMDEVMSSPVGIMRFQEVLCKELDRGIRIRDRQRKAVHDAISASTQTTRSPLQQGSIQSPIDLPGLDLLEDDEVKALLVSSVEMLEERIAMAEEARERLEQDMEAEGRRSAQAAMDAVDWRPLQDLTDQLNAIDSKIDEDLQSWTVLSEALESSDPVRWRATLQRAASKE